MSKYHKNEDELNQELLLIKAAQDDPSCFDVLYNRYFRSVFIFVHKRICDEQHAADITSHVFLKALINLKKYEYKGVPFSAWLFRIAFNEVNMYFRKNNSDRHVSIDSVGLNQLSHDVTDAEDQLVAEKRMMEAMGQLDEAELQLLELRFFEKRSFAEVAVICGITENNSKVKVYRILDKLKKILKRK